MNDPSPAELELQQKYERRLAEQPKPVRPTAAGSVLPPDFGKTRETGCETPDCPGLVTQTRGLSDWAPTRCETCRGVTADQLARSTADARGSIRLADLDVPRLYERTSLETFQLHGEPEDRKRQMRLLTAARRYLADWPEVPAVVVFRGAPGSGKGHLAWSIAKKLVELHDVGARVVKLGDTIRDLREAWRSEGGPSEAQRLTRYRSPDLLVVDEVSRHAFYGEPQRHLYDLVDHRVEQCRPTILTTNERLEDFAELMGPALTSRAANAGVWEFGDVDYRLAAGRGRAA